jgi:hypothetical protein
VATSFSPGSSTARPCSRIFPVSDVPTGLRVGSLSVAQLDVVMQVLKIMLSASGYPKVLAIMGSEHAFADGGADFVAGVDLHIRHLGKSESHNAVDGEVRRSSSRSTSRRQQDVACSHRPDRRSTDHLHGERARMYARLRKKMIRHSPCWIHWMRVSTRS